MRVYAETDFILALAKKDDWLKPGAQRLYQQHKGDIETSVVTIIEVALVAKRHDLDLDAMLGSVFELAHVRGIALEEAMRAAHLITHEGVGVFDAFHAVMSRGVPIMSSEKVYERIGVPFIPLRESK